MLADRSIPFHKPAICKHCVLCALQWYWRPELFGDTLELSHNLRHTGIAQTLCHVSMLDFHHWFLKNSEPSELTNVSTTTGPPSTVVSPTSIRGVAGSALFESSFIVLSPALSCSFSAALWPPVSPCAAKCRGGAAAPSPLTPGEKGLA